ncbi:MAG: multicopper oxidase domain-containing protein [Proteobacteria bacterium]|nr:multicopper oxidase domain-containing protein [Pseudomonadota bacterium]MBU2618113.1 multicopper oxidase domain-containing protein [Pseudomonadota bacterium]
MRSSLAALLVLLALISAPPLFAATVEYDLFIAEQEVNITGQPTKAMTINTAIPGPVLRFTEGDLARIRVHNRLATETSIHWHGLLVPPGMDGVPYVSFPPIGPGATFTYEFPLRQSGTYWYHSHSGLQEQRGLYGAIVIAPRGSVAPEAPEQVILFSDWTDEDPHAVLRTLKRGSDWYAVAKGSGQSLLGAARLGMLGDFLKRELQRMPPMDIADVAYDRFLANGQQEIALPAAPEQTLRLRLVNGSATTYFHLEFAGGPMTIVAADGLAVEPLGEQRLLMAVAETYDVLITVPADGAYEFRATAHDGSGFASVWLGEGSLRPAPDVPRPNLYQTMGHLGLKEVFALTPAGGMGMADEAVAAGRFDQPGMMNMHDMAPMAEPSDHGAMDHSSAAPASETDHGVLHGGPPSPAMEHGHGGHGMPAPLSVMNPNGKKGATDFTLLGADAAGASALAMDGMAPDRPWPPYERLRAAQPTAFAQDKPVREIRLTLDGDMERYVWEMNNVALTPDDTITIRGGEVTRFIMINRTMMHHPMHLHGHFFRVLNGRDDARAPLKHTVDVAPMATTVIEFYTDEPGDWLFHCHLLYHMESGMARIVHYEDFAADPALLAGRAKLHQNTWFAWGEAVLLNTMTEGGLTLADRHQIFSASWEAGWERVEETEWETLFTWERPLNTFFGLFVGLDLLGERDEIEHHRGVAGISALLPLMVESRAWLDVDGGARFSLEKNLPLTPRLKLTGEAEYDTHEKWEGSVGLAYLINQPLSLVGRWHSAYQWGVGLELRF